MHADADLSSLINKMRLWLHGFVAAFQFLSRLPLPIRIEYNHAVFQRSTAFYPLVGGVIGLLLWLLAGALQSLLPTLPAAVLVLIGSVALTGGLHLDGLMDTADGLLSHRPREQMLDIMKDSRVGAMGVIVCVLHLLLKGSLIYVLMNKDWLQSMLLPFILIPVWSRWWMTASIIGWPYARPDSGLGGFFRQTPKIYVVYGAVLGSLISVAAALWQALYMPRIDDLLLISWIVPLVMIFAGWAAARYMAGKLGGLTGDTYGASNELLEAAGLLAAVVLLH